MTRPPLSALQSKLDGAARLHPDSPTLADFRADEKLVALEEEALAAAESVVTPHAALASSFGARGIGLKWARPAGLPRRSTARPRPTVHFPMSTLGRKGVYELRAALRGLPVDLTLGGPVLERAGFWEGRATPGRLRDADVVVAPSFVESAPRSLLVALASGVPVIATPWCGIPPEPGLCVVPTGDAERLRHAIEEVLASSLAASAASVA